MDGAPTRQNHGVVVVYLLPVYPVESMLYVLVVLLSICCWIFLFSLAYGFFANGNLRMETSDHE